MIKDTFVVPGEIQSNSQRIFHDRLQLLHQQLLTSMPAAFLCATIIFFSLYQVVNHTVLISWYLAAGIIFILRFSFYIWYKLSPNHGEFHMRTFVVASSISAMIWGIAGTVLMPAGYFLNQTVIIVIVAGVTAGSMQTLQPSRIAGSLYIIFSILPLSIWLIAQETRIYYLLSVTMMAYMIFMLIASKRGYELILSSLKLRYENIAINAQLENINKKLQVELVKHQRNEKLLAQLAAIVEFSNDAIIGLDIKGIIQSWNKGAELLYGYTEGEVIGKSITMLSMDNQKDLLESMVDQVIENLNFQIIEFDRQDKFGRLFPVSVTLSPIKNDKGVIIGISSVDRDISEQKKIDKLKNEFISTVSHELRTPLTSIKGSLGLLLSNSKKQSITSRVNLLEIAYNNCERLIRLINDILDIEKIESGKLEFKFTKVNLKQLIQHAIEENLSYADKYHVAVQFVGEQDAFVHGDEDRLMQVLTNLISNAVKFTRPNTCVEVKMSIENDQAKISITDCGEGIPQEYQSKIFEKFTQADSSSTRSKGGTGLGLSICKAILEAHHSEILFTTKEGKGTTFYFQLMLISEKNLAHD